MVGRRRNFHLPLSDTLYDALREEADRLGRPATELAREALEAWLEARRRAAMFESIAEYAGGAVGGEDLDEALESAATDELLTIDEDGA